jgi:hypothetical protein
MIYVRLIGEYVLARTLVRTDILSAVVGALLPAAFYLLGHDMPADFAVTISLWVASSVVLILLIRLLAAPYVIWTRDQAAIVALKDKLAEPNRRQREILRDHFLEERANLAKMLAPFVSLEKIFGQLHTVDIESEIRPISTRAFLFITDQDFGIYWQDFCMALRRAHMGAKFHHDNILRMPEDKRRAVIGRAAYDLDVMSAAATAMIRALVGDDGHRAGYSQDLATLNERFVLIDKISDPAALWIEASLQSPDDAEARTSP